MCRLDRIGKGEVVRRFEMKRKGMEMSRLICTEKDMRGKEFQRTRGKGMDLRRGESTRDEKEWSGKDGTGNGLEIRRSEREANRF